MERLVDALSRVVAAPLDNPLRAEHIAVPSPGMERWLSMELSQRLGVWANPAFPFPRKLVDAVLSAVLGQPEGSAEVYEPASMLFGIARLLPELAQESEFAQVAHYLKDDRHARSLLPLARRIADVFDHYATYRPDEVLAFIRGDEQHWQAQLMAAFSGQHGPLHIAARATECLRVLTDPARAAEVSARLREVLPERVSLFGISTLPPLYVQLLAALGRHIDVHLFLLSPSREYYGDLRSYREAEYALSKRAEVHDSDIDALHYEAGHPLLASLGRHGRELQVVLEDSGSYQEISGDLYEEPGEDTLLHLLQSDLLSLTDRSQSARSVLPSLEPADASISIHSCHGAMREVEVLHDQLLALFSRADIKPHDVIVMTPDIEAYAPMIDAVFSESSGRTRIPFRIADRGALRTHPVVSALDALLDACAGRMGASTVVDLLGVEVIRQRFEIAADEVESVRELVAQSAVRWGVDAAHRDEVGQPERDENTWRFGLSRLALGFAMPSGSDALFLGHAPSSVDASDAELLGKLLDFCDKLFELRAQLSVPATFAAWERSVRGLLATMIVNDAATAHEHKLCLRALEQLVERAKQAGFEEIVELASLRGELAHTLDASVPAHGFLAGGVTFCQLVPMRSIPFKAVCMLGLNDGAFPAADTALGFDLIAKHPRRGDRSRRNDDRQLFLEALLSAREQLLITYVGQSMHDGKPQPPSVLVSELIEHVARSCRLPGEDANANALAMTALFERRLVVRHPLKAWSARYFEPDAEPGLFSYAQGASEGAKALLGPRVVPAPFFARLAGTAQERATTLTLTQLERWLDKPLQTFMRQQLELPLGADLVELEEREPMDLNALERWRIGSELLARARELSGTDEMQALLAARGELPLGSMGKLHFEQLAKDARAIAVAFAEHARGQRLPKLSVDLEVGGVRILGELSELWPEAQVRVQYSRAERRYELRLFLRHLLLGCLRESREHATLPSRSVLVSRAKDSKTSPDVAVMQLMPVAEPRAVLARYVELYMAGQSAPVPLLEHASRAYQAAIRKPLSVDDALAKARAAFAKGARGPGSYGHDEQDPYVHLAYASFEEVLAQRVPCTFEEAAEIVYGPLLAARTSA